MAFLKPPIRRSAFPDFKYSKESPGCTFTLNAFNEACSPPGD
jgi:hypothetical protein